MNEISTEMSVVITNKEIHNEFFQYLVNPTNSLFLYLLKNSFLGRRKILDAKYLIKQGKTSLVKIEEVTF